MSSGLLGTAVNLVILGAGLELFARSTGRAIDAVEGRRPKRRASRDDYSIFGYDNYQQPRKKQKRNVDADDMFSLRF